MGLQRIVLDVYYSHEGAVDIARKAIEAANYAGASPVAAAVVNHPGEADEKGTFLIEPPAAAAAPAAETQAP